MDAQDLRGQEGLPRFPGRFSRWPILNGCDSAKAH
jgi:hypothetical protein